MFLELVDILFLYNTAEYGNQTYISNKVPRTKLTFHSLTCHIHHNNVTNLILFHFHDHFIVSWSSTCFGRQASIFRRHYTSRFFGLVSPEDDAWPPKHVEDQNTIKWLWKWTCIKLVTLLWYIMIHGQQNVKCHIQFNFNQLRFRALFFRVFE
jgi:hypothetical protein